MNPFINPLTAYLCGILTVLILILIIAILDWLKEKPARDFFHERRLQQFPKTRRSALSQNHPRR